MNPIRLVARSTKRPASRAKKFDRREDGQAADRKGRPSELWAGPVQGGDLQAGNRLVGCSISNIGDNGIEVTIEMFAPDGKTVAGPVDFGVFPHGSVTFPAFADGRLCKFSGNFYKSKVRAAASTFELITGQLSTTASLPP